jgi:hypothetical protein
MDKYTKILRKNVNKIKLIIKKNKKQIFRLVASEDFMLKLQDCSDLIDIEEKQLEVKSDYEFNDIKHKVINPIDQTFLWGVPCFLSNVIKSGAVLEMQDSSFVILKNI